MDIAQESISDQWYNKSIYLLIFWDKKKLEETRKKQQ